MNEKGERAKRRRGRSARRGSQGSVSGSKIKALKEERQRKRAVKGGVWRKWTNE